MTTKTKSNENILELEVSKTDWRSIYVANIVAFLSSIQMGAAVSTIWPFMKLLHPSVTENTFGLMRGSAALANIITSGLAGYFSNRISNTKPSMILGKIVGVIGSTLYLFIEVYSSAAIVLFFIFDILHGIAGGMMSVFRTHIAMNSLESERAKAFGLTMLASAVGFMIGPVFQIIFTRFGYPGWSLFFGLHWNLYTAPIFLSFITSIVGIILLIFFFNGKMHVKEKNEEESSSIQNFQMINTEEEVHYDRVAMVVIIFMKVIVDLNMIGLTISGPYTMTIFAWTSQQSVLYHAMMMTATGCCSLVFAVSYVFFKLGTRISERTCLIVAFGCFLFFYLMTYPWFFIDETIPYEHIPGDEVYYSQAIAKEAKTIYVAANESKELVGCSVAYSWCQETPRVNVFVYNICAVLAIGIGFPLSQINLDILYSKILGPIKQGVHQAVFFASGQVLNVLGPVIVTRVYTSTGPRWIWFVEILASMFCLFIFVIFYSRLIPYSKRVQKKSHLRELPSYFR
ncbi:hypothetical protein FO519_007429 [Halicephalobus sp. NKZ332]|nr:hypothetical protein FO519_007429 [Halicephalobus sp. NKZ332]